MAKVTIKEIKPVTPPPEFVLTLDIREAMVVCKLCGSIAGKSEFRDIASKIYYALREINPKFEELYRRPGFAIPDICINNVQVPKP